MDGHIIIYNKWMAPKPKSDDHSFSKSLFALWSGGEVWFLVEGHLIRILTINTVFFNSRQFIVTGRFLSEGQYCVI